MNPIKLLIITALVSVTPFVFADEAADRKICIKQLGEIAALNIAFAASHDGRLPESFDELLSAQKTRDPSILVSPLAADKTKPSYELLLPGKKLQTIAGASTTLAIRSLYTLRDGRYLVAFPDGHVEIRPARPNVVKSGMSFDEATKVLSGAGLNGEDRHYDVTTSEGIAMRYFPLDSNTALVFTYAQATKEISHISLMTSPTYRPVKGLEVYLPLHEIAVESDGSYKAHFSPQKPK